MEGPVDQVEVSEGPGSEDMGDGELAPDVPSANRPTDVPTTVNPSSDVAESVDAEGISSQTKAQESK